MMVTYTPSSANDKDYSKLDFFEDVGHLAQV